MNGKKFYIKIKDYNICNYNINIILKKKWCEIYGKLQGSILYFPRKEELENDDKIIINGQTKTIISFTLIKKKLLFLAVDGVRSDAFALSKEYFFKNLINKKKCLYSFYLQSIKQTWSSWSWASILTGKKESHKIKKNDNIPINLKDTFVDKLIDKNFGLYVSNWNGIYRMLYTKTNKRYLFSSNNYDLNDKNVTNKIIEELDNDEIEDINIVYFEQIDNYGHKYGFSPCTKQYNEAINRVSIYIENIYSKLEKRISKYNDEEWLVIICSDHGGTNTDFMNEKDINKIKKIFNYKDIDEKGIHGLPTISHRNTICFISIISENKMEITGEILPEPKSIDIYPTILNFFDVDTNGRNLLKR